MSEDKKIDDLPADLADDKGSYAGCSAENQDPNPVTANPGPSATVIPEKSKGETVVSANGISKQIADLIKKRAELRRRESGTSGKKSVSQERNHDLGNKEKPLPQRTPNTRAKPRVVANVQLAPPKTGSEAGDSDVKNKGTTSEKIYSGNAGTDSERKWTEVRKRRRGSGKSQSRVEESTPKRQPTNRASGVQDSALKNKSRKAPKTSAVMITGIKEGFSYATALKKARESISLEALKIEQTKVRKAANGGLIIEIVGPDGANKAAALRDKLREVLPQDEANITRPIAKGKIRFVGVDCTTSSKDVLDVILKHGGGIQKDIKIDAVRPMNNGLYTAWVQCPLVVSLLN